MEVIGHISMIKDRRTYIILAGNMIPMVGFFFFEWDLIQAFLFYLFEIFFYYLLQFPKIVLFFKHQTNLVKYKRRFLYLPVFDTKAGKAFASSFFFFINTFIFFMCLIFFTFGVIEPIYSVTIGASHILNTFQTFFKVNYLVIIYIFIQYLYNFIYYHIHKKEYLFIPYEYQTRENYGRNILLFIAAIFLPVIIYGNIFNSGAINEHDNNLYNLLILFSMFVFKLVSDYFLIFQKKKLISQYEQFKNGVKI